MGTHSNIITELMGIDTVNDVAQDAQGVAYDALSDAQVVEVLTDSNLPLEDQLDALETTLQLLRKQY